MKLNPPIGHKKSSKFEHESVYNGLYTFYMLLVHTKLLDFVVTFCVTYQPLTLNHGGLREL